MQQSQLASRIRTTLIDSQPTASSDDLLTWMGGEASVGTQARQYLRRQEGQASRVPLAILGLTFLGGLAAGSLMSSLWRKSRR